MNGLWSMLLVCAMALSVQSAQASRLGGGDSLSAPQGVAVALAVADAPSAIAAPRAAIETAVAPSAGRSLLGGVAASLGLAWVASRLGMGEGFERVLLVVAVLVIGAAVLRWALRSKGSAAKAAGLAYASASGAVGTAAPQTPRAYSPKNVGNDASARPWESSAGVAGHDQNASPDSGLPEGFDEAGFLKASRTNFVNLQAAWDRADIPTLRAMMTDDMLTEIRSQLDEREANRTVGQPNQTDVVMLEAQLLGIEDVGDTYMASVEFSGLIREEPSAGPSPFREVWNMTKPKSGQSGWLVAGVQALQ